MAGLFIKLDTNFWSHPRILAAGEQAAVLYQQMAMYCMDHATDGHVPDGQLPRFGLLKLRRRLTALADAGLIVRDGCGWVLPGYVERYKTAAEVAELRRIRAEAGRKGGRPRKQIANQTGNQVALTVRNPEEEKEEEEELEGSSSPDTSPARLPARDDDDSDDHTERSLARELLELAGLAQPRPTMGELRTIGRLAARGWSADQLRTMATRASLADVDPRAYLAKMLAEAMNARPDGTPRLPERRALLDDERTPCTDCGASGWVDAADGTGVLRCTTCTGART